MSLSEVCVQQHEHEHRNLKRLLLWGLLGSLGAHGIALTLGRFDLLQKPADPLTPIELIVTEPPTEPEQPTEITTQTNEPASATASAPPRAVVAAPVALESPEPLDDTLAESALEEPQAAATATPSESPQSTATSTAESATTGSGAVPDAPAGASPGVAAARSTTNGRGQGQGSRTIACQNCVRPSYPQSALAAGVEGQPMVFVDINPDGTVRNVTLTRSSGNAAIDQAVIQAARRSRFQPIAGGASVPIAYDLTIEGSRRHRESRRRSERQAVELPSEAAPTTEAADSPTAADTTSPSAPPVTAAPAAPQPAAAPSASEPTVPVTAVSEPPPARVPEPAAAAPADRTPEPVSEPLGSPAQP